MEDEANIFGDSQLTASRVCPGHGSDHYADQQKDDIYALVNDLQPTCPP
ncbi:hypothetical protein [Mycolicibacterium sarraceniae]|nr:hypothetical protein [Mycolicibacterium sarraceniae]